MIRPRTFVRQGARHGISAGTRGAAVPGVTAVVTASSPAGSVQAITGSPGRIIRPRTFVPRKGTQRGFSSGTLTQVIPGVTPAITVAPPAGTIQAVTGSPGKTIRPRVFVSRKGARYGVSAGTLGATITGLAATITATAPAGSIQAFTGSPGKTIRPRLFVPRKGAQRGVSAGTTGTTIPGITAAVTAAPQAGTVQAITGSPGRRTHGQPLIRRGQLSGISIGVASQFITGLTSLVNASAPAGSVQTGGNTTIPGVTAAVTVASSGTVTAVTGSPGQTVRPRTFVRKGFARGVSAGTIGATITGVTAAVTVAPNAGTIQAFTGSPGRVIRPRIFVRKGLVIKSAHGVSAGTIATTVTGVLATATVAANAGTVQAVTGSPGKTIRPRTFRP